MPWGGILNSSNDLNDLKTQGYYRTPDPNDMPTNMPDNDYAYSGIYVVNFNSVIHQYIIRPYTSCFYIREYSGSPAAWSSWMKYNSNIFTRRVYTATLQANSLVSPFSYYSEYTIPTADQNLGSPVSWEINGGRSTTVSLIKRADNYTFRIYATTSDNVAFNVLFLK